MKCKRQIIFLSWNWKEVSFWGFMGFFIDLHSDDPCTTPRTAVGTTRKWCGGLQGMAGSRSWRTRSSSRCWADAGLAEPTADWRGARQACEMALKATYRSMTLSEYLKNLVLLWNCICCRISAAYNYQNVKRVLGTDKL